MVLFDRQVTFAEVPSEISYTLFSFGCPRSCKGCSWSKTELNPYIYTLDMFMDDLKKYVDKCSCVCFLGGEWHEDFPQFLLLSRLFGFKTCLYSGMEESEIDTILGDYVIGLDYLKVGPYVKKLGGLNTKGTNQHFYVMEDGKIKKEIKFYEL